MPTEADTCRKFVVPKLQAAGWDNDPHSIAEQRSFTDGRIIVRGSHAERKKGKRADYLLRYTRDFIVAMGERRSHYYDGGPVDIATELVHEPDSVHNQSGVVGLTLIRCYG